METDVARVLVVEDDVETGRILSEALTRAGHAVDCASDGRSGETLGFKGDYDLLVVDRMLPDCDGLSVVSRLRSASVTTPVLFLTALGSIDERVQGLRGGGDDYLAKPYALAELLARTEALLRRSDKSVTCLVYGNLHLDLLSRKAQRGRREIALLPREFQILEVLMRHAGQVVTRAMLLEQVWNYHFDPKTKVVEVHISHLRQKIDRGEDEPVIETIPGSGYRLNATA